MTTELSLAAALLVGLLGSVHCVGMCAGIVGTLAAAMPRQPATFIRRLPLWLCYNGGRIASYALAGALAGQFGGVILELVTEDRVRQAGALLSGAFMIALGLYLSGRWRALAHLERAGALLWRRIEPIGRRLVPVTTPLRALAFGAIWGWLPCGLVYAALAWSLASADPLVGAATMLAFGIGTLPALLVMGGAAHGLLRIRTLPVVRTLAGGVVLVLGILVFLGAGHPEHVVLATAVPPHGTAPGH